ncbi:MAG TPA: Crp/Fnr family transcriptional regulator [Solirubrobacteraceae bacterium]
MSFPYAHPDPTAAPLLDLDPDLGAYVPAEQLPAVRRALRVPVATITRGHRQLGPIVGTGGFLLLDGLVVHRLALAGSVGLEPLGPGDIVTPATSELDGGPLPVEQSWTTAGAVRLAILPEALPNALARLPGLAAAFMERQQRRAERARVLQAIATVTRVDVRILALLWHLAGRWGRVTPEGIRLRVPLTHRLLAELIGARRPTVTTALGHLESRGALSRRPHDEWLLCGSPPAARGADDDDADDAGVLVLP